MQRDSPCADVEVAESGGCCNLGGGSCMRGCRGRCCGRVPVSR
jgi:hypothetical protein